jgi:hypothetical protein
MVIGDDDSDLTALIYGAIVDRAYSGVQSLSDWGALVNTNTDFPLGSQTSRRNNHQANKWLFLIVRHLHPLPP